MVILEQFIVAISQLEIRNTKHEIGPSDSPPYGRGGGEGRTEDSMKSALEAIAALGSGFATTFKHLFRKPITEEYPEYKRPLPERSRAVIVLTRDPDGGERDLLPRHGRDEVEPGAFVGRDPIRDEDDVADLLERIEHELQAAPNSTRYVMNSTLISIGCRPGWMKKAIAVARKVGKVDVDFGSRNCQVRDAASTIKKTIEHYEKQGKRPIDGTAGQRRRHC